MKHEENNDADKKKMLPIVLPAQEQTGSKVCHIYWY